MTHQSHPTMMFDPLLTGTRTFDTPSHNLDQLQQELEAKRQQLEQVRAQAAQQQGQSMPQQSKTATPVWDEINAIMEGLSDSEYNYITNNDEFVASQSEITNILQSEYLRLMRPLVEGCQAGKDALDRHLTLVKRLRKTASKAVEDELAMFQDYRKNYAHISWEQYQEMRRNK